MPPRLRLQYLTDPLRTNLPRKPYVHNSLPRTRFSSSSSSTPEKTLHTRLQTLLTRLPKSTHKYTTRLLSAPKTHIISFLLLHELTAILPLLGLTLTFHYTSLPSWFVDGKYVQEGVERFGRYFARKGWFGFSAVEEGTIENNGAGEEGIGEQSLDIGKGEGEERIAQKWNVTSSGSKILIEVATAYAITKVLLPARVLLSVWGTPWFARVVVGRVEGLFGRFGRKIRAGNVVGTASVGANANANGRVVAAGTGATGGGVIGKGS